MADIAPQRNPRVRIRELEVLSDAWYTLRRVRFDYLGTDGTWSRQEREAYDRGNGATILLTDPARDTVLLTRQFRLPAYLNGHADGMLLETPAGLLDGDDAETAIRREAEEETGYRIGPVTLVCELFMSPGSVTERVAFFHGSYSGNDRVAPGGGVADEGEDIETIELSLAEAIALVERGEIVDAKTVLLLQWAQHRADRVTPQPRGPRMILIAGPVRGGTGDDPDLIERNIARMTRVALSLFERGQLPVVGEWFSMPLIAAAGSKRVGDDIYDHLQHPLAEQLLARCDGCLRIGGDSSGADQMVATARTLGKPVWFSIDDVPQERPDTRH